MLVENCVYEDPYVTSEIFCPHLVLMHVNLANISRGHEFFCKQQIVSNSKLEVKETTYILRVIRIFTFRPNSTLLLKRQVQKLETENQSFAVTRAFYVYIVTRIAMEIHLSFKLKKVRYVKPRMLPLQNLIHCKMLTLLRMLSRYTFGHPNWLLEGVH